LNIDGQISRALDKARHGYLHVAFGTVRIGESTLTGGDAMTFAGPADVEITAIENSQLLFFDLA